MGKIEQKYGPLKIIYHPDKLKSLLEKKITAPLYIRIKPTNQCNHKCFYCAYVPENKCVLSEKFDLKDSIPKEVMMNTLSDFKEIGVKALTFSGGGEPLLYKNIIDSMKKTIDYGIDLSMITNGQLLKGERAEILAQSKWVRISLDSIDPETFVKTRGISQSFFYELIDNIKNFAQKKNPNCELGINFIVSEKNANKVYDSIKFFKELGVNHIKLTPVWVEPDFFAYHTKIKDNVIEQISQAKEELKYNIFNIFDTYENDFNLSGMRKRSYPICYIMQIAPVIGADSNVYLCHDKAYTTSGILGSLKEKSFKDLWFSEETEKIFKNFNPQKSCKHHCTFDSRNILIKDILDCYGDHINFI